MTGIDEIRDLLNSGAKRDIDFKSNLLDETKLYIESFIKKSVQHMLESNVRYLVIGFPLGPTIYTNHLSIPISERGDEEYKINYRMNRVAYSDMMDRRLRNKDLTIWICEILGINPHNYLKLITENTITNIIDEYLKSLNAKYISSRGLIGIHTNSHTSFVRRVKERGKVYGLMLDKKNIPPQDFIPYSVLHALPKEKSQLQAGRLKIRDSELRLIKIDKVNIIKSINIGPDFLVPDHGIPKIDSDGAKYHAIHRAGPMQFYTIRFPLLDESHEMESIDEQ